MTCQKGEPESESHLGGQPGNSKKLGQNYFRQNEALAELDERDVEAALLDDGIRVEMDKQGI